MELKRLDQVGSYRASGAQRLAQLAAFVEALPPGKLTFGQWYAQGRGCAVGLVAAHDPWFQAQGLRLQGVGSPGDCRPTYGGAGDWAAVTAFFELSPAEARQLFDRLGYEGELRPSPRRVAERIRQHLVRRDAPAPAG